MIGWPPAESAPGFEKLRWVEVFRGPYRDAKRLLERLDEERFPSQLQQPHEEERHELTEVVILVPKKLLARARELLDADN